MKQKIKLKQTIAQSFFGQKHWCGVLDYPHFSSPSLSAAAPGRRPVRRLCRERAAPLRRPGWCRPGCALSCCAPSRCPATTRRWSWGSRSGLWAARGDPPADSPPRRAPSRSSPRRTAAPLRELRRAPEKDPSDAHAVLFKAVFTASLMVLVPFSQRKLFLMT